MSEELKNTNGNSENEIEADDKISFFTLPGKISKFVSENNISSYAASAAFFMVLSIFPLLILICSALPYLGITLDGLLYYLADVVPQYILDLCKSMFMEYDRSKAAIISVTAILAVWASGKGAFALGTGIASINGVDNNDNFLITRIRSSLYTVCFILIVFFFLIVMVWGNRINNFLVLNVPNYNLLYAFIIKVRFLFVWIFLTFFFQIMYSLMPGNERKFFRLSPGSLFASLGWSFLSWGFSLYIDTFGSLSIYGDFVGVIFALLWLYWCMYIVLIGGAINRFYSKYMDNLKNLLIHKNK